MKNISSQQVINLHENSYPEQLKTIHSPPKSLYMKGAMPENELWVALVGSRRATSYGKDVAHQVGGQLAARGVVIVSGLAHGIDTTAHQAAIEAGGKTVAVLGSGFDHIYPRANTSLIGKIIETGGAVLSEYPPPVPPLRQHFPARNRIIAGLCQATVVVEAALSSGSLITANFALEEGREVLAVPGNINQPASAGCNNLIKAGATPLTDVDDLLQILGLQPVGENLEQPPPNDLFEAKLHQLIKEGIRDNDELVAALQADMSLISRALTSLELNGYIRSLGGGQWTTK